MVAKWIDIRLLSMLAVHLDLGVFLVFATRPIRIRVILAGSDLAATGG
jgi:hypothetical protein